MLSIQYRDEENEKDINIIFIFHPNGNNVRKGFVLDLLWIFQHTLENGYLYYKHYIRSSLGWNKPSSNFGNKMECLKCCDFRLYHPWKQFNVEMHARYSILYSVYAFVCLHSALCIMHTYYFMDASSIQCIFFPHLHRFLWKSDLTKNRSNKIKSEIVERIHYQTTIYQKIIIIEVVKRAFCRQCSQVVWYVLGIEWKRNWRNERPDAIHTIVRHTCDR